MITHKLVSTEALQWNVDNTFHVYELSDWDKTLICSVIYNPSLRDHFERRNLNYIKSMWIEWAEKYLKEEESKMKERMKQYKK